MGGVDLSDQVMCFYERSGLHVHLRISATAFTFLTRLLMDKRFP